MANTVHMNYTKLEPATAALALPVLENHCQSESLKARAEVQNIFGMTPDE
jgi:hypothetical protein